MTGLSEDGCILFWPVVIPSVYALFTYFIRFSTVQSWGTLPLCVRERAWLFVFWVSYVCLSCIGMSPHYCGIWCMLERRYTYKRRIRVTYLSF